MNILVIGCDQVGAALIRDLERIGHDISVVEKDPEQLKRLDAFDDYTFHGTALVGDPTDPDTLRRGGVEVVQEHPVALGHRARRGHSGCAACAAGACAASTRRARAASTWPCGTARMPARTHSVL